MLTNDVALDRNRLETLQEAQVRCEHEVALGRRDVQEHYLRNSRVNVSSYQRGKLG